MVVYIAAWLINLRFIRSSGCLHTASNKSKIYKLLNLRFISQIFDLSLQAAYKSKIYHLIYKYR